MQKRFTVEGMSCAACSSSVERVVSRIEGVTAAQVNLLAKSLLCEFDPELVSDEMIIKAVERAGFKAFEAGSAAPEQKSAAPKPDTDGTKAMTLRLVLSIGFLLLLMYVSMGHMAGLPLPHFLHGTAHAVSFAFIQFLLALPVVFLNRKFYSSGFKALFRRAPNMDSLVAIGSAAAMLYGIIAIFFIGNALGEGDLQTVSAYSSNLYFESAAMILTLVTVGKLFEERAKGKTGSAISKLMDLSPKTATVLRDGKELKVSIDSVVVGDVLIIRPGDRIPVDGVVVEGSATIDASAMTGESMPLQKSAGDSVLSASISVNGYIQLRAVKVGNDTTLAQMIALVENAGASKAPIARLADKVSGVFVPIVISISLVTGILWMIFGAKFDFALSLAISVLVISCPCALGLATPVAITVGIGKMASNGVLIKSAEALETLHAIDTVVMDKTGTLTRGKPVVTDIVPLGVSDDELLKLAASLEHGSAHPLAAAIVEQAKDYELFETADFESVSGKGVSATVDGAKIFAGNSLYMQEIGVSIQAAQEEANALSASGKTVMFIARNGTLIGYIAVADVVKPHSADAVAALRSAGKRVIMLTGDSRLTAEAIKNELGLDEVIAEVLPADKEGLITRLKNEGRKVAMVGDGINDSPALAAADVGIAVGGGTDIAIEAADVVLMKDDLRAVPYSIDFSKKTMRNIKQNLFWAFFYNSIGIPVAAGVLYPFWQITLSPMIAAAAMSFSSVFVVTNALRLYRK
ncbi:MAG: heavy metal translocating P-type ATPase [Clostridia bacterium]|nr:heavy metal translocating P-type ATPase [Clostridia bacterium]